MRSRAGTADQVAVVRRLVAERRLPLRRVWGMLALGSVVTFSSLLLLMPVTRTLAELPIYWGYVAPRLRAFGSGRWTVIGLVGAVLSLQDLFFSFRLDGRYDLWLAVKFLPFALWTGYVVDRRPAALPYLMTVHFLIDATLPVLVFFVSRGMSIT